MILIVIYVPNRVSRARSIVNLFGLMGLTGSHYEYSNYDSLQIH